MTTSAHIGGQLLHWFTLHPKGAIGARARRLAEAIVARTLASAPTAGPTAVKALPVAFHRSAIVLRRSI
jgi:hypothetical protein